MVEFTDREKQLAICHFLMKICSKERFIEIKRQILSEKKDFEPYVAYRRILRKISSDGITSKALRVFLDENLVTSSEPDCDKLIKHYSNTKKMKLNFKEFLNMILPKENPDLRTQVSLKDVYEIKDDEYLEYETEISLALLLEKELDFFNEISEEKNNLDSLGITEEEIIMLIDSEKNVEINFDNMFTLFRKNNQMPYDEEIISFQRRIDKDDDGVITLAELKDFFSLIPNWDETKKSEVVNSAEGSKRFNLGRISVEQYKRISPARKIAFSPERSNTLRVSVTSRDDMHRFSKSSRRNKYVSKRKERPTVSYFEVPSTTKEQSNHVNTAERVSRPNSLDKIKVSISDKNFFVNSRSKNSSQNSNKNRQNSNENRQNTHNFKSQSSLKNVNDQTRTTLEIKIPTKRSADFEDVTSFDSGNKKFKKLVDFEEPSFSSAYKKQNQKTEVNDITMANTISDDKNNNSTDKMKIVIKDNPKYDRDFHYESYQSEELLLDPSKKLDFKSSVKLKSTNNFVSDSFNNREKQNASSIHYKSRDKSPSTEKRLSSFKKFNQSSNEKEIRRSLNEIKEELVRDFPCNRCTTRNRSYFAKRHQEMKHIEDTQVDKYKKKSNSRPSGSKNNRLNNPIRHTSYFDSKEWRASLRQKDEIKSEIRRNEFSIINGDMKVSPMRVKNSNSVYLRDTNNHKRYLKNEPRKSFKSTSKTNASKYDFTPINDIQAKKSHRQLNSLTNKEKENYVHRLNKIDSNVHSPFAMYPTKKVGHDKTQTLKNSPSKNKSLQESKFTVHSKNSNAIEKSQDKSPYKKTDHGKSPYKKKSLYKKSPYKKKNAINKSSIDIGNTINESKKKMVTTPDVDTRVESPRIDQPERYKRSNEPDSNKKKDTQIELFDCVINVLLNEEKSLELCRQELVLQENFYPLMLFNSIDTQKQAWFDVEQFESFLETINVTILERNKIIELYGYYDRSQKQKLNFEEFCKMLEPRSEKHNLIFNKLKKHHSRESSTAHDPLSNSQITRVLRDLFRNLFSLKSSIVESKKLLAVHDVNLLYVFNKICDKKCGNITKARFVNMMKEKDSYIRNAKTQDIVLQFEKLDLDQDDVISYKDFVQAFSQDR